MDLTCVPPMQAQAQHYDCSLSMAIHVQVCEAKDSVARALTPAGAVDDAPALDLACPNGFCPITTAATDPDTTSQKVPPFPPPHTVSSLIGTSTASVLATHLLIHAICSFHF